MGEGAGPVSRGAPCARTLRPLPPEDARGRGGGAQPRARPCLPRGPPARPGGRAPGTVSWSLWSSPSAWRPEPGARGEKPQAHSSRRARWPEPGQQWDAQGPLRLVVLLGHSTDLLGAPGPAWPWALPRAPSAGKNHPRHPPGDKRWSPACSGRAPAPASPGLLVPVLAWSHRRPRGSRGLWGRWLPLAARGRHALPQRLQPLADRPYVSQPHPPPHPEDLAADPAGAGLHPGHPGRPHCHLQPGGSHHHALHQDPSLLPLLGWLLGECGAGARMLRGLLWICSGSPLLPRRRAEFAAGPCGECGPAAPPPCAGGLPQGTAGESQGFPWGDCQGWGPQSHVLVVGGTYRGDVLTGLSRRGRGRVCRVRQWQRGRVRGSLALLPSCATGHSACHGHWVRAGPRCNPAAPGWAWPCCPAQSCLQSPGSLLP